MMQSAKPTIPVPKRLPGHAFLQPHAADIRAPGPGPSPISTPGLSDETSEPLAEEGQRYGAARCDNEGLARSLGLPDEGDIASGDHQTWYVQRSAEEARSEFLESTSDTSSTTGSLNPNAGEFIPSSTREIGRLAPEDEEQVDYPWKAQFNAGAATIDTNLRKECARKIVLYHWWNAKTMKELTEHFVTRVRDNSGQDLVQIACFAKAMSDAFRLYAGGTTSGYFKQFLMRSLWYTFATLWQEVSISGLIVHREVLNHTLQGSPTSFLTFPHQNSAAKTQFSPKALTPALTIAAFIPELFTHNLVHLSFVYQCLHLLVDNMCWIEQLRGARAFLCRLDYRPGDVDPAHMRHIVRSIKINSARIKPGQSALDAAFGEHDVNVQLEVGTYQSRSL